MRFSIWQASRLCWKKPGGGGYSPDHIVASLVASLRTIEVIGENSSFGSVTKLWLDRNVLSGVKTLPRWCRLRQSFITYRGSESAPSPPPPLKKQMKNNKFKQTYPCWRVRKPDLGR